MEDILERDFIVFWPVVDVFEDTRGAHGHESVCRGTKDFKDTIQLINVFLIRDSS